MLVSPQDPHSPTTIQTQQVPPFTEGDLPSKFTVYQKQTLPDQLVKESFIPIYIPLHCQLQIYLPVREEFYAMFIKIQIHPVSYTITNNNDI